MPTDCSDSLSKGCDSLTAIAAFLKRLGFQPPKMVIGRASIADLYRPPDRCGLYVLHFNDGEHYAGQAVDVTRRFAQHRHSHGDITAISFKKVPKGKLSKEESELIGSLERRGFALRNIDQMSVPKVIDGTDFDSLMSEEDQSRWLRDEPVEAKYGRRIELPELRQRYRDRFQEFLRMPHSEAVIAVLREYVRSSIPAAIDGEMTFWCCSCIPSFKQRSDVTIYSRINISWQEVFTAAVDKDGGPFFTWHLARSALESGFGGNAWRLRLGRIGVHVFDHKYKPGGQDQMALEVWGISRALRIIDDPCIKSAARLLNLRLVRKGSCTFNRYHCPQLADLLLR